MTDVRATPRAVLVYGLLGLSGFLGPPTLGWLAADYQDLAATFLSAYAALILSFLGGARWGLAVAKPSPPVATVSLSMLPTLWAVALMILPPSLRPWQFAGLAMGLAFQWLWDVRARGLPDWYPRLRTVLSAGALAGLAAGMVVLTR